MNRGDSYREGKIHPLGETKHPPSKEIDGRGIAAGENAPPKQMPQEVTENATLQAIRGITSGLRVSRA